MKLLIALLIGLALFSCPAQAQTKNEMADEKGFVPLFDGKTLNGWKLVRGHGPGRLVRATIARCEGAPASTHPRDRLGEIARVLHAAVADEQRHVHRLQ